MKKYNLLIPVLMGMCVSLTAGCDGVGDQFIDFSAEDIEYAYVTGGGMYETGAPVFLRVYPNKGCDLKGIKFTKKGETTEDSITALPGDNGSYYRHLTVGSDTYGIPTVTSSITQGSTDAVTSGAVYNAIGDIETLLAAI